MVYSVNTVPSISSENNSVPQQWAAELREVLAGINNTGDISTYLSSLSFTVANFLNTNANQVSTSFCLEFLIRIYFSHLVYLSCISRAYLVKQNVFTVNIMCILGELYLVSNTVVV